MTRAVQASAPNFARRTFLAGAAAWLCAPSLPARASLSPTLASADALAPRHIRAIVDVLVGYEHYERLNRWELRPVRPHLEGRQPHPRQHRSPLPLR